MSFAKSILLASALALGALVSPLSSAEDSAAAKKPGAGPNPYSDCGIGAALFRDIKWAAVTSNVIWDLGTTAITSATASPQTCTGKNVTAAKFIIDTYTRLAEETASGQGEHLTTVLNIFECDRARHAGAISQIRGAMKANVSSSGYFDQSETDRAYRLYTIIDNAVGTTCPA